MPKSNGKSRPVRQKSASPPPMPRLMAPEACRARRKSVCAVLVAPPSPTLERQSETHLSSPLRSKTKKSPPKDHKHLIPADVTLGVQQNANVRRKSSPAIADFNSDAVPSLQGSLSMAGALSSSSSGISKSQNNSPVSRNELKVSSGSSRRLSNPLTNREKGQHLLVCQLCLLAAAAGDRCVKCNPELRRHSASGPGQVVASSTSLVAQPSTSNSNSSCSSSKSSSRTNLCPALFFSPGKSCPEVSSPIRENSLTAAPHAKKHRSSSNGSIIGLCFRNNNLLRKDNKKLSMSSSLHQLYISGLNTSSTDMRSEHTVRSGHQEIQTLYAANNVTYPDSISINLVNAPDNSTVQCDCGHINCPLCNLMMNLELTDPSLLK